MDHPLARIARQGQSCMQQSNYPVTLQGGIWKSHGIASINRRVPERSKSAGGPEGLTGQSLMMIRHTIVVRIAGPQSAVVRARPN